MATATISVRGLETPQELVKVCRLSAATFGARDDSAEAAQRVLRESTESPEYCPGQWRGAFRDGRLLGGYIMHEREMRVGAARLRTACIGSVVTDPAYRMGGAGRALMLDAIAHARHRNHAILLLDGIPDFYHRFGYVDVFDLTEHCLAHEAIEALPVSSYQTRAVEQADAAAVLGLHERGYNRYTGSFERSLAIEQHRLRYDLGPRHMVLALDEQDIPRGYLEVRRRDPARATEVAAVDWKAILALLQAHARLLHESGEPTENLHWPLPPDSPILTELTDRLALPDTARRQHVTTLWSVESRTYHHPNTGWMARPADAGRLLDSLVPAWRERWEASNHPWKGTLRLEVEGVSRTLVLDEGLHVQQTPGETAIRLASGSLVQLVFGYRDAGNLAARKENHIPEALVGVLRVLFPLGHAWIPGTDAF